MAEIDSAQEWRRLQELYADMSEDELAAVAKDGYALTDIAKQALRAEIASRNLKVIVRLAPPVPEIPEGDPGFDPATLDLTAAWSVENREQAAWVKKTLNDAGIPCYFGPDLLEDVHRLEFTRPGGLAVRVLKHDHDRVRQALKDFAQNFPSPAYEEPVDFTVRCPQCNSAEIMLLDPESDSSEAPERDEESEAMDERSDTEVKPAPSDARFIWKCDACGYEWQDDDTESES